VDISGEVKVYQDVLSTPSFLTFYANSANGGESSANVRISHRYRLERLEQGHSRRHELRLDCVAPWIEILGLQLVEKGRNVDHGLAEDVYDAILTCDASRALRGSRSARAQLAVQTSDGIVSHVPLLVQRTSGLAHPEKVVFGRIPLGSSMKRRILMKAIDSHRFRILNVSSEDPQIHVDAPSVHERSTQFWLTLGVSPKENGRLNGLVNVATDHPVDKAITIAVEASGFDQELQSSTASLRTVK
jgi:hypothetical protein